MAVRDAALDEPKANTGLARAVCSSTLQQDAKHAAQRFGRAPQQLIADGERTEVFGADRQLPQPPHRHFHRAGDRRGCQPLDALFASVANHADPRVAGSEHALDFGERDIAPQLDRQRLAVAAHRSDADTDRLHDDRVVWRAAENLVGLRTALPLLEAHAVAEILVDPGNETAGERHARMLGRKPLVAQDPGYLAIDVENSGGGVVEQILRREVGLAHLLEQLAHT